MNIKKLTLKSTDFPGALKHYKGSPKVLYHVGAPLNDLLRQPSVTIVGTRQITPYGARVTRQLARELAGQGIVIVSGLAFGVDAAAHEAALKEGGKCIAVLPGPLDRILPATNRDLAATILKKGGALISEYAPGDIPQKQNFIARNRIMAGLSQLTVITEAGEKSGALHTARFAQDQNKDVLVVPGNIYHDNSRGVHHILKSGAGIVTETKDVLHALGLRQHKTKAKHVKGRNANEQKILDAMIKGLTDADDILDTTGLSAQHFAQAMTMLELGGKIEAIGGNNWAIY